MTGRPPPTPTQERRVERAPDRAPSPLRRVGDALARVVRGVRNLVTEARSGQRPLVVALAVSLVLGIVMLSGPAERYLDGRTRVEGLRTTADALDEEVASLEAQVEALEDPDTIEANAREQQGMIRPGEVPFTLVPPEVDRPRITAPRDAADAPTPPWYARAWDTVRGWF